MKNTLFFITAISFFIISEFNCNSSPTQILYDQPVELSKVIYIPANMNEGIYPCKIVLENENNPFRSALMSNLKWNLQSLSKNYIAKYYCWATCLAHDPNGESQYYTAINLRDIANSMSDGAQKDSTKKRAVSAYYSVLVNFPQARGYANGADTVGWSLLPSCVSEIRVLGGDPSPYVNIKLTSGDSVTIINK